MRTHDVGEQLARMPLFADLPPHAIRWIWSLTSRVERPAGAVVARQGQPVDELVLVGEGQIDVRRDGAHAATLGPGDCLGEVALLAERSSPVDAIARTAVTLHLLGRRELAALLADAPAVAARLRPRMAARLAELDTPTGGTRAESSAERGSL